MTRQTALFFLPLWPERMLFVVPLIVLMQVHDAILSSQGCGKPHHVILTARFSCKILK